MDIQVGIYQRQFQRSMIKFLFQVCIFNQPSFDTDEKSTFMTATYIERSGINQDNGFLTEVIPLMFTLQK